MHPSDSMVIDMLEIEPYAESMAGGPLEIGLIVRCTECGEDSRGLVRKPVSLRSIIGTMLTHVRAKHRRAPEQLHTFGTYSPTDDLGQPLNAESVDGDGGRRPSPPHRTCVDVSKINDRPGTAYVCGPACPCADEWQPTHAAGSRPQQCATCSPSCAHPWHSTTTLDGEPIETTCPQCGDRA